MDSEELFRMALKVRENSYSPYSRFKVGAALKLKGVETPILGTNVENSSYGATICAERSAILAAIAQFGKVPFEALAVVADCEPYVVPCAACLGVIAEFCDPDFPIYCANLKGIQKVFKLKELLPSPFRLEHS
jgi:cytidine deaminase